MMLTTMKSLLTFCLVVCSGATNTAPEPEPAGEISTTSLLGEPEPAADTESSSSGPTATTSMPVSTTISTASTTTTRMTHTVTLSVSLNISTFSNEATLLQQLSVGMESAVNNSNIDVVVVIQSINVKVVYGGLSQIVVDDISTAFAAMSGLDLAQITVNGNSHSIITRRLSSDAEVVGRVPNTANNDVVAEANNIISTASPTSMASQLQNVNATAYTGVTLSQQTPVVSVEATSQVTGLSSPPEVEDIISQVSAATGGVVTATVVGVSTTTPLGPLDAFQGGTIDHTNSASTIAPLLAILSVIYAFASN